MTLLFSLLRKLYPFSALGIAFFFGSSLYALTSRKLAEDVYFLAASIMLFGFWYWSLKTVQRHRDYVRKVSGEHVKFNDVEFL